MYQKKNRLNPILPITAIEELQKRIKELEIQVAVGDTLLELERIRRQLLVDDLLDTNNMEQLKLIKKPYESTKKSRDEQRTSATTKCITNLSTTLYSFDASSI